MREQLRRVLRATPFYHPARDWAVRRAQRKALVEWERQGKPAPPPHVVKEQVLRDYSREYALRTLVETGTCYGDMVQALRAEFDLIYSIELSSELFKVATRRFKRARNVRLVHGDSALELGKIVDRLDRPALFWLDGHYSGGDTARGEKDTPILDELRLILSAPITGHVVIVDDARLFGTDPAYPCLDHVRELVRSMRPDMALVVDRDSVRITPGR